VAVLVRTNDTAQFINKNLNDNDIPSEIAKGKNLNYDNQKVKVMTLHSAKGLEFPIVAIARVDSDQIPVLFNIADPEERNAKLNEERNLFSVGMSRAMRRLAVTFNKEYPSKFIDEINTSLWEVVD